MDEYSKREGADKRIGGDAIQSALRSEHPEHPTPYIPENCPACEGDTPPVLKAVRDSAGVDRAGFQRTKLYAVLADGAGMIAVMEAASRYEWTLDSTDPDEQKLVFLPEMDAEATDRGVADD